jgi:hypothetical protein
MPRENFTFLLCKYKEQHNKTVCSVFKHRTIINLYFGAGNIFPTLCNTVFGCLSEDAASSSASLKLVQCTWWFVDRQ